MITKTVIYLSSFGNPQLPVALYGNNSVAKEMPEIYQIMFA
jgi:hypothetical protein